MQIKTKKPLRVGLFGIGLDSCWPQFKGLKQRLEGYVRVVRDRLKRAGVEVVNLGLINSPFKALEAGHRFRQEDVDLIFLHVTTCALSSPVLPVVQRANVPVAGLETWLRAGASGRLVAVSGCARHVPPATRDKQFHKPLKARKNNKSVFLIH